MASVRSALKRFKNFGIGSGSGSNPANNHSNGNYDNLKANFYQNYPSSPAKPHRGSGGGDKKLSRMFGGGGNSAKSPSPDTKAGHSGNSELEEEMAIEYITSKREAKTTSYPRFPSKFLTLISDIVKNKDSLLGNPAPNSSVTALQQIRDYLNPGYFEYSENELNYGRRSLLQLWSFILLSINNITDTSIKLVCRDLLSIFIDRKEFQLPREGAGGPGHKRNGSNSSVDSGKSSKSPPKDREAIFIQDIQLYRELLIATLMHVRSKIRLIRDKFGVSNLEFLQFAAKVIAVVFIRVPFLQKYILDVVKAAKLKKDWTSEMISRQRSQSGSDSGSLYSQSQGHSHANDSPHGSLGVNPAIKRLQKESSGSGRSNSLRRRSVERGRSRNENLRRSSSASTLGSDWMTFDDLVEELMQEPKSLEIIEKAANSNNSEHFSPNDHAFLYYANSNPSLYRWNTFKPYVKTLSDEQIIPSDPSEEWVRRLVVDAEFFLIFVIAVGDHILRVSNGKVHWQYLSGFQQLLATALCITREALLRQWLDLRSREEIDANPLGSTTFSSSSSPSGDETGRGEGSSTDRSGKESILPSVPAENLFTMNLRAVKSVLKMSSELVQISPLTVNTLLTGLLESTNIYNSHSIGFCTSQLEAWMSVILVPNRGKPSLLAQSVSHSKEPASSSSSPNKSEHGGNEGADPVHFPFVLPRFFDRHMFVFGLKGLLATEHFENLKKILLFLYRGMDNFDGTVRNRVVDALVENHYRLFLHWHREVRSYFHFLLIYKVYRGNRMTLQSVTDRLLLPKEVVVALDNLNSKSGSSHLHSHYSDASFAIRGENRVNKGDEVLWTLFDAQISMVCVKERSNAKRCQQKHRFDVLTARNRAVEFAKLKDDIPDMIPVTSMSSEGCPGAQAHIPSSNDTAPPRMPSYLKYLPTEEQDILDEILTISLEYDRSLQSYAHISLREYTDALIHYYEQARSVETGCPVEPPALGFN